MIKGALYQRASEGSPLQLCVSPEEGTLILEITHIGTSGAHQVGHALTLQVP